MNNNHTQYSPHLQKVIQARAKYTSDDRVRSSQSFIKQMERLNNPSYEGAQKALMILRGGE